MWDVSGFEPRKSSSFDADDQQRPGAPPLVRRYSISASSLPQHALAAKVQRLKDNVEVLEIALDCLALCFSLRMSGRFACSSAV